MSFFGLGLAGKALSSFQEAANVTSDNISNLNTPGASRQVANITEAPPISGSPFYAAHTSGTLGDGSMVASVTRVHDASYDTLFRGATASQAFFQAQQAALTPTESAFAEPNNGINSAYSSFQTAVSTLAAQPGDTSSRSSVISSAQALARTINSTAAGVQTQKNQVLANGASVVSNANTILDQIGALNGQIRASTAVGDNPNTFADQRDHLIDQLAALVSTQTSVQANGSTLVTVNGLALVNDQKVYHLAPPVITQAANGSTSLTVGFEGPQNAASPASIPVGGGQLGGLLDVYNNKLTPYSVKLDKFANGLASEVDRVTQSGYDANGSPGGALFGSGTPNTPVTATNISVGITDPSLVPAALASTGAGTIVAPLNAANNTVQTSAALGGNATLANPPPMAGLSGTLTVNVDGTSRTFAYSTASGGSAASIDSFVQNFNSGHFGVSASFDSSGQRIVFSRDPNNVDAAQRALAAGSSPTPSFTITDSLQAAPATLAAGQPAASLLEALGAGALSSVAQDATNAYGSGSNGAANALTQVFSNNVGVPGYQTTSTTGVAPAPTAQAVTLGVPLSQFPNIKPGDRILVDSAPGGNPETVVVTAVDTNAGTISAVFTKTHAAGFSVAASPDQTLGSAYGSLVTQLGLDAQNAQNGVKSQTTLSASIDKARQGIDGINIDEETQNLLKYQNAYQAAAHVVSVLDSLLNTVITTIGARL